MADMTMGPLFLSLKVAGISTLIVFITGVLIAFVLARKNFPGKSVIESLFLLPLVLPPTVVGFGLLILFGKNGWVGRWLLEWFDVQIVFTWIGAVIASVVVSFPLMYQSSAAAFQSLDKKLEQAARTMGASEWRVFWTVSFPLAWPGILAGLVLAFARGLGEFGATLMLAGYIPGKTDTIPLAIYFAVEAGQIEKATYWVIVIVALGFSTMMWLNWWSRRNLRRFAESKEGE
ncbi:MULTISPECIES: molybdate ABC transporter permease subunit [Aneurinibacillus]|uniref:Molybdenum transport system permease n=1 Tax=Aneurinibacillus thermoaerophilus TaxID=143495 RepID=A0A1G8CRR9_ANETH|nr:MULTISPECIES: molybdate ABC transporter permease subunit [Aneurinibacillus]AMA71833.1 ABC transporter permease [Aneurinibacillus sp. XH2]MED0680495.1 molybdate ABC transporter permease subunit [Aneurinibacillus thermoaerophilus]MED0737245.1 molybdate ABC transporter permease subunit [Aneurinibacillus thermoaerophilus]MED0757940.1 molybdate ABC transporter permease subunit [Aneurinibacillus thermoaerophilus]MED0761638.1 molybdate ABC transporter permease subunit [Aneurinibacillus thermoaerop